MLVMAIEAARQHIDPHGKASGYTLDDVASHKAVTLREGNQGTELQFFLTPTDLAENTESRHEFRLYLYEGTQWSECCRGAISVEHKKADENNDWSDESHAYLSD